MGLNPVVGGVRGVPCGGSQYVETSAPKGIPESIARITDLQSVEAIAQQLNVPEPMTKALSRGLSRCAGSIAQIPDQLARLFEDFHSIEATQLGLVMVASGTSVVSDRACRHKMAAELGAAIVKCCFRIPAQPSACGSALYESPETADLERGLVDRLRELGQSMHLCEVVANVVAEGLVCRRETLIPFARHSKDYMGAVGSVVLAQINEQHTRDLKPEELQARNIEVGHAVVDLFENPVGPGWSTRKDSLIDQMHTFNP